MIAAVRVSMGISELAVLIGSGIVVGVVAGVWIGYLIAKVGTMIR